MTSQPAKYGLNATPYRFQYKLYYDGKDSDGITIQAVIKLCKTLDGTNWKTKTDSWNTSLYLVGELKYI